MFVTLWAAGGAAFLYAMFIVPTKWLKIERIRHPLGLGIRILQISDLHVEMLRIKASALREIISREKPDLLVWTGDFTRREKHLRKLEAYLGECMPEGIPAYAVLGNHDYSMRKAAPLLRVLQRYGIRLLRNETVRLESFDLVGIDDHGSGKSMPEAAFRSVRGGRKVVVITHDPEVVLHIRRPYDYLMAGHLHGRQLNIPFFLQLKRKGKLASSGIYKGLHHKEHGTFYISKGIGQAGINARFLVRSEITIHEL